MSDVKNNVVLCVEIKTLKNYNQLIIDQGRNGKYIGISPFKKGIPDNIETKCMWKCNLCDTFFKESYYNISQGKWCEKYRRISRYYWGKIKLEKN